MQIWLSSEVFLIRDLKIWPALSKNFEFLSSKGIEPTMGLG
jgi:hypothetical protein